MQWYSHTKRQLYPHPLVDRMVLQDQRPTRRHVSGSDLTRSNQIEPDPIDKSNRLHSALRHDKWPALWRFNGWGWKTNFVRRSTSRQGMLPRSSYNHYSSAGPKSRRSTHVHCFQWLDGGSKPNTHRSCAAGAPHLYLPAAWSRHSARMNGNPLLNARALPGISDGMTHKWEWPRGDYMEVHYFGEHHRCV